jgi:CMP-N-acetylneuraminic acid synthetase
MKKVLCIIPARSGSKTIKNKNIYKFNKRELIYYSIKFANSLNFINKTIFSSDSKKYLTIAKKYGSKYNYIRPQKFSGDNSQTIDLVNDILKNELKRNQDYGYVLILQPTSPFRIKRDFKLAYENLINKKYDSAITVSKVDEHPERMKIFKKYNRVDNFMKMKKESLKPRQKLSQVYIRAGSMYFTSVKSLYKNNSLVGKKVFGIKVKDKYSLNIDTKKDLILAKYYFDVKNRK